MKKTIVLSSLLLLILVATPISVQAATFVKGQSVYVGKDETITDNLYAVGSTVTIDGTIKGDLICAGGSIIINGKVEGDVIGAGQNITVNGEVGGNVRTLSGSINVNGKINGNLTAAAGLINLQSNAQINKDAIIGAGNLEVRGKIARDLIGAGGNMIVAGEINGNTRLWVDKNAQNKSSALTEKSLTITDQAKINGNLTYTSRDNAGIATGATIKGETKHNFPKTKDMAKKNMATFYGWMRIVGLFAMLVVGMVLVSLWREEIKKITEVEKWQDRLWKSLGWGLIVLILTPFVIIILMITIIGFPLALMIGGLWLIALYISKILAAIVIGRMIVEKWWSKRKDSLVTAMILGVFILWLLCFIPLLGSAVCLIATLWGLGTLWLYFKKA